METSEEPEILRKCLFSKVLKMLFAHIKKWFRVIIVADSADSYAVSCLSPISIVRVFRSWSAQVLSKGLRGFGTSILKQLRREEDFEFISSLDIDTCAFSLSSQKVSKLVDSDTLLSCLISLYKSFRVVFPSSNPCPHIVQSVLDTFVNLQSDHRQEMVEMYRRYYQAAKKCSAMDARRDTIKAEESMEVPNLSRCVHRKEELEKQKKEFESRVSEAEIEHARLSKQYESVSGSLLELNEKYEMKDRTLNEGMKRAHNAFKGIKRSDIEAWQRVKIGTYTKS